MDTERKADVDGVQDGAGQAGQAGETLAFGFHAAGTRKVVAKFDGGHVSSDGGAVLLRELENKIGIIRQAAGCFSDNRDQSRVEHSVETLVGQRVMGLALGYEDLNDHDALRLDPMLGLAAGVADPMGANRPRERDKGKALAGKSTLNRLELAPIDADKNDRYKKIGFSTAKANRLLVDFFTREHTEVLGIPKEITLDVDATHVPIHGEQSGVFFHGYYDCYCYLPLYVICGDFILAAKMRPSSVHESKGVTGLVRRIVELIRATPGLEGVRIIVRGDCAYSKDSLMSWCESNGVFYTFGLAQNPRVLKMSKAFMEQARELAAQGKEAVRVFADLEYNTRKSWSRKRRVVLKAEHLPPVFKGDDGKANPRFVVTNLPKDEVDAKTLYEVRYCARGDIENRIKEQQMGLFADRMSAETMRANQIRLFFSTIAYTLMASLRRRALRGTELEKAQASTIRTRLLKIGVLVAASVRAIWLRFTQAFPLRKLFAHIHARLTQCPLLPAVPAIAPLADPQSPPLAVPDASA